MDGDESESPKGGAYAGEAPADQPPTDEFLKRFSKCGDDILVPYNPDWV